MAAPVLAFVAVLTWVLWPQDGPRLAPSSWGNLRQVTAGEFPSAKPAFSPDGKLILYISSSEETRGHGDVFVQPFPHGKALRITEKVDPSGDMPVFTGDSASVVFAVPRLDHQGLRHHDLWMVQISGGLPRRLIEDASGAGFSPWKVGGLHQAPSLGKGVVAESLDKSARTHSGEWRRLHSPLVAQGRSAGLHHE
jgi:Tol biopolymer transport system component